MKSEGRKKNMGGGGVGGACKLVFQKSHREDDPKESKLVDDRH